MELSPATRPVASLERHLGDPRHPERPASFAAGLASDAEGAFPAAACEALDAWGLARFYVPAAEGGALDSLEHLAGVVRAVARRDLTVAIAHAKTFLGAAPVWVAGTPAQRADVAADVLAGDVHALCLTEEAHGGDLLATDTRATRDGDAWRVTGTKWLINNATRGAGLAVFARTDPRGGARGFSMFHLRKRDDGAFVCTPRVATHGIRGADISGIRFEGFRAPPSALVGGEGRGLEVIMKVLQVTRAFVPALSLGALDAALRHVVAFARERRIGATAVAEIPHARRALVDAFVELLAMEALVRVCAREASAAPERLAVASAVSKYLAPTRVDEALGALAEVLGARRYLRGDLLEKIRRDHSLVPLFDGSTVVNLNALAQELPHLTGTDGPVDLRPYRLHAPTPPFRFDRLDLVCRGDALDAPVAHARAAVEASTTGALRDELAARLDQLAAGLRACTGPRAPRERALAQSPAAFANARAFARLYAARACALVWAEGRAGFDDFFARGEWLALALRRLLTPGEEAPVADWYERAAERLLDLEARGATFAFESLTPEPTS